MKNILGRSRDAGTDHDEWTPKSKIRFKKG